MNWLLLSPFSITVLNVAVLLILLVYFLSRTPEPSPATRSVLTFLSGVSVVFLSFFWIFSSVDPVVSTRAWWILHLFVFPAVAMVQFAYHFPENPFPEESRRAFWICLLPALAIYPYYLHHTRQLTPTFSFEGFLYVFLDTPEVGAWIGVLILWMLVVLGRKALGFERQQHPEAGPASLLRPRDRRSRLIRNLMVILFSPLVLLVALILAYLGHLSWGLVGHILGTGLMVAAFLFAVLYINNCPEPSTFMIKLVGISMGSVLIVLGLGGSLALDLTDEAYDSERRLLLAQTLRALERGEDREIPPEVTTLLRWPEERTSPVVLRDGGMPRELLASLPPPEEEALGRRSYLALSPLDARRYLVVLPARLGEDRIQVGFPYLDYRLRIHQTCLRLLWVTLGTVVGVLLIFPAFFRLTLLRPMDDLLEGVGAVNDGDRDARVPVRVEDEIGFLSRSFNRMVSSVQEAERELQQSLELQVRLTDAYSCFFPREFLEFLDKESVLDIALGDSVRIEMTILFSDIRSFTNLSETMTPQENFRFLNDYLGRVGPLVRDRGGFIDKYIGDAVMALFPRAPGDAVAAAVAMQDAVRDYNRELAEEGRDPIGIGIGIHTGAMMLGTIGEEKRMEGTVISDAVNLASRLEGLTKLYGAAVLVSEATLSRLGDPGSHRVRFLDRVQVKGKLETVGIHEVLDGHPEEVAARRQEGQPRFQEALDAYRAGSFEVAEKLLRELLEQDPEDVALALYLQRCAHYREHGTPEAWDGVTSLKTK